MLENIFNLNNGTDQSLSDYSSSSNFGPYLIPVALTAIAAFTQIGFYAYRTWNRFPQEQSSFSVPAMPVDFTPLSPSNETQVNSFKTEKESEAQSVEHKPEAHKEGESRQPKSPLDKNQKFEEAKRKHIEFLNKELEARALFEKVKKELKGMKKTDKSREALVLKCKEAKANLDALDDEVKKAYKAREEAFKEKMNP